ncbi:MAG: hypothetical protein HRT76_07620, partial [Halieaceae bacterium]|nr:hypothetical protein [Halieaceae bacterium]
MRKFNLVFSGKLLPGYTAARARAGLAKVFDIDDSDRLKAFFSGDAVVLRRALDRKEGGDLFRRLREIGMETELVLISEDPEDISPTTLVVPTPAEESDDASASLEDTAPTGVTTDKGHGQGMTQEIRRQRPGQIDQSWAVPSSSSKARSSLSDLKRPGKRRADTQSSATDSNEAAALKALEDAQKKADRAAQEKARKEKATEEAAKRKAEEQARKKKAAEVAAKRKAEERARKKQAAEEAAKRKAEERARKKQAAEEAAKRKAEERASKKKAAEEAAKL